MWPDNETTTDLLGFKVHADLIRSVVIDPKMLPLTIGVYADWGGGKTSVMRMLERDLNPDGYGDEEEKKKYDHVACIYFNGWLFEGYDDAKSAILSSVLQQLIEHKRFGPKIRDKAMSLLKSVNWMRVARLVFTDIALPLAASHHTGGLTAIPALSKAISRLVPTDSEDDPDESDSDDSSESSSSTDRISRAEKMKSSPLDVRTFRDRFEKMLSDTGIHSLVVLIDDLDRCSPERIIDNLEAIKLFLSVENTAFVIGADPRIVRHAIATRYRPTEIRKVADPMQVDEASDSLINDYLEKLIQVPYRLPRLSPSEIESYMALLFCFRDLDDPRMRKCLNACDQKRERNRYAVFGFSDVKESLADSVMPDSLSDSLRFSSASAPLITAGLKGNPRQVKRFLNALSLRRKLAVTAHLNHVKDDVLVKLMVLEYTHPDRFNELFLWQSAQDGLPDQLRRLEQTVLLPESEQPVEEAVNTVTPSWTLPSLIKWLRMQPSLSDVDLRDYFWIARDRLQSSFDNASMIPPIVRQAYDDLTSGDRGRLSQASVRVHEFQEEEFTALFRLLIQKAVRNPEERSSYDAIRGLIEKDIPGSVEVLVDMLKKCPAKDIPPAVGADVVLLLNRKPEAVGLLKPILDELKGTSTQIGAALSSAFKARPW